MPTPYLTWTFWYFYVKVLQKSVNILFIRLLFWPESFFAAGSIYNHKEKPDWPILCFPDDDDNTKSILVLSEVNRQTILYIQTHISQELNKQLLPAS